MWIRLCLANVSLQSFDNEMGICYFRLEHIKQQVKSILGSVATIKKEELIYKKAFARRCQNLLLAETEVLNHMRMLSIILIVWNIRSYLMQILEIIWLIILMVVKVDLLGDQVEALQDLLGKIYYVLVKNSSVLSYNCEVGLRNIIMRMKVLPSLMNYYLSYV